MKKLILFIAVIALSFTACSDKKEESKATQAQAFALPVKIFKVNDKIPTIKKSYSALIKPVEEVDVIARVAGTLEEKYFKEGEHVKKGQLLYKIEQDTYKANLDDAKASVKKAQANYNKAFKDYKRANSLLKNKAISVQSYDDYVYTYEDAQAQLQSSKASLQKAQIEYNYTTVKAPIDGIVGIKHHDIGDYVGTTSDNSSLVTITAINPVHVEFSLSNADINSFISQIRGKTAKISLISNSKVYKDGFIDYIAPSLDAKTDTLLLRAKFENANDELLIGEFVNIEINNLVLKNVKLIPENALLKTAKGDFVYVVQNDTATLRPIEIGSLVSEGVIIKKGLNTNDKVIISNIAKLRPNTKVQIINEEK